MHHLFRRFVNDQSGVTAVEYGLIAGLIAVVIIGAVTTLGTKVQSKFQSVADGRGERHLMMRLLIRFVAEESGLTAVEYALIAGLMALGIIVSVSSVGTTISTKFYGPLSNGFS